MISRRNFVTGAAALLGASGLQPSSSAQEATPQRRDRRPNILVFMPDQQQGSTVLPESHCLTPHMDAFLKQSVAFENMFCPSPHCCPSRASFMSGLYPSEHGVYNNVVTDTAIHWNPYPGTRFFSTDLKAAGYNLAYAGKWHVARDIEPHDVGWKELTAKAPGEYYHPFTSVEPGRWKGAYAQMQKDTPRAEGEVIRKGWGNFTLYETLPEGYENLEDYKIMKAGIDGMKELAKEEKPWCVMISDSGGHDYYRAPKNFVDKYDPASIKLPKSFRDDLLDKPAIYQRMRYKNYAQLSEMEVRKALVHYWAKISLQDELFGKLLAALEETGQAENTIVIYTSDHGDYGGSHGIWAKGIPSFREAYNIPCVVRWPEQLKDPGRRVRSLASTVDLAPTVLDAAGLSHSWMSGASLLPWVRNETPQDWRESAHCQCDGVELYYTQRIVITKDHKYVYNGFDFDEMYDLNADPDEMVNLAHPNRALLAAQFTNTGGEQHPGVWPPLPPALDDTRRDMLRRMWTFAEQHRDYIFNPYMTVTFAPYGPGVSLDPPTHSS